jgi:hypothetical protein
MRKNEKKWEKMSKKWETRWNEWKIEEKWENTMINLS